MLIRTEYLHQMLRMGPPDQEAVEGCREGVGVKAPKGPLG